MSEKRKFPAMLPCPFCGTTSAPKLEGYLAMCGECYASAPSGGNTKSRVAAWNRRPIEDRLARERDEAREAGRLAGLKEAAEYMRKGMHNVEPVEPRCPRCSFVMCEEFDERPINDVATLATPNGAYVCRSNACASMRAAQQGRETPK